MPNKVMLQKKSEKISFNLIQIIGLIILILIVVFIAINFVLNTASSTYKYTGNITDIASLSVDSVKVTGFNGETTFTDEKGNYLFKSSYLGFGIITFEKEGFVPLHKQIYYGEDTTLDATMIKEVAFQKVDPTKEIFIEMESASLKAEANSFIIKGTNEKATTANISLTPFDPSNEIDFESFPGDLSGIRFDGSETYFESISFMKIQVRDDLGRPLDLASGKTAEVKFPVPSTLSQKAPDTIPLWYFSPTEGRWIERGEAKKICEGNNCSYVGKIDTIASWWNCDTPIGDSKICGSVKDTCKMGTLVIDTSSKAQSYTGSDKYTWGCRVNGNMYRCIINRDYCGSSNGECIIGKITELDDNATHNIWKCANKICYLLKPVTGVCGTSGSNDECEKGDLIQVDDNETHYNWKCNNTNCSLTKVITGECGLTKDSCIKGTFEDQTDTDEKYNWMCKGSTDNLNKNCDLNKPINGVCGTSNNECLRNTVLKNSDANTTHFKWTCGGLYGGTDTNCVVPKIVDGACGTAKDTCLSGDFFDTTDTDVLYNWKCNGRYGGTSKDCNRHIPVNGDCGLSINECKKGILEDIYDSPTEQLWLCDGLYGGTDATCTSDIAVNGQCATTLNDCKDGNFIDKEDSDTKYLWTCAGLNNGTTDNCEMDIVPADGVCGYRKNACKVGDLTDLADVEGQYNWRCDGLNGGSNTPCSFIISDSEGSCGTTLNNCTGGTFVDTPDSDTYYKWDCVDAEGLIGVGCYFRK